MVPRRKSTGITVQGRYTNGAIAALVAPYGRGKVGLCGPHPDLGDDLIDTFMAP